MMQDVDDPLIIPAEAATEAVKAADPESDPTAPAPDPDPTLNHVDVHVNAFEEERQILLDQMARQLREVLQRMERVNTKLDAVTSRNQSIGTLSSLWTNAYHRDTYNNSNNQHHPQQK